MEVKLVNSTKQPIETMMYVFMNMHKEIPNDLGAFIKDNLAKYGGSKFEEIKSNFIQMLISNPLAATTMEFVNLVWYIGGVSRAFQQQLTRSRNAAYCIQSLRIVDVGKFHSGNAYTISQKTLDNPIACKIYDETMEYLQNQYRKLIDSGAAIEDARGILPLNIHSPITMTINLRNLEHLMEYRLCHNAQGEYREVAARMRQQIKEKMDPRIASIFRKPCDKLGRCPLPFNCGKTEYKLDEVYKSMDLDIWLKG